MEKTGGVMLLVVEDDAAVAVLAIHLPVTRSTPANVISLREIPTLAAELASMVLQSGFQPQRIVYVETGARLVAWEMCAHLGVSGVPVLVQRPGAGLKRQLVPLLRRLPRRVTSLLRRIEEQSGVHKATRRVARFTTPLPTESGRVLLVDDAADTGETIRCVREAIASFGIGFADIRTAVLAATTEQVKREVDYWILDRNVCFPWSSDSTEREQALAEFARKIPPAP